MGRAAVIFCAGWAQSVALPAFASLGVPRLLAAGGDRRARRDRQRHAAAIGVRVFPERCHPGVVVAEWRGG